MAANVKTASRVVEGARSIPYGHEDLGACYRLRHDYFVRQRGWVPEDEDSPGEERDRYDARAFHLACCDEQGVAAYLRALPYDPALGFMFDNELGEILCEEGRAPLPRHQSLELSRLVVRPGLPLRGGTEHHPVEDVLRLLYRLSIRHGYDRYYIVVEESWLAPFARRFGLPFRALCAPHVFPDGTSSVLAVAMLHELEAEVRRTSPSRHAWYQGEDA